MSVETRRRPRCWRPTHSMKNRIAMYNGNALKIGLFGANCSSGRSATKVPERWSASWPDCLAVAKLADEAGLDFMLPIARWKGYGGDTDFHGHSLETITWAVGLLAATKRMTVFGTVHAPLFHPLIAAKEFVTADHIGEGRVGVNLVVGWNEGEFDMFGVKQREHDARYDYAQEWIDVVKAGLELRRHLRVRRQISAAQGRAGLSEAVRRFAAAGDERRRLRRRAGLRRAQLRRVLRRHGHLAHVAWRNRRQGCRGQGRRATAWPRDRGVHRRPGDLPADAEGSRGLLSARQYRQRRLGRDRLHAGQQAHDAADDAAGRI